MNSISSFQIFAMIVNTTVCLCLLLIPATIVRRNRDANRRPFFWGMLCYIILGVAMKYIFISTLQDSFGSVTEHRFLNALLSGVSAALIIDGGRFLVVRFLMRKYECQRDALMFGAGYGGTEVFLFSGLTAFFGFTLANVINNGHLSTLLDGLDANTASILTSQIEKAYSTSGWTFLVISIECVITFVLEMCLSIMIYRAARDKTAINCLWISMGIHFAFAFIAQILSGVIPLLITELLLAAVCFAAYRFAVKTLPGIKEDQDTDLFWDTLD